MESTVIEITSSALAHGRLNIKACGRDFFPKEVFGRPKKRSGRGQCITLRVKGLPEPIHTDLPTDAAGRPRWFFRDRKWVKQFVHLHGLVPRSKVRLTRIAESEYLVEPVGAMVTFIDLFAGIGGMRLAFEAAGAKCVFSCEWDRSAQKTYAANFGDVPAGDIRTIPSAQIPDHDILVAGFPCQPFSIAGVSKKNALGHAHGFRDKTQGTLFFEIKRIIEDKQPRAFLLENVRNLKSHDRGRTFSIITDTLRHELGYQLDHRVIDAKAVVPQHRERIYLVGSKPGLAFRWPTNSAYARHNGIVRTLGRILEREEVPRKYTLTDHLWAYLKKYAEKHRKAGNGFGYGLCGPRDTTRTLSARYYKDGSEILIRQARRNPRRLTPRECARLMGFPETFTIPVSDTAAYKQFGNSVVVPVVAAIARELVACIDEHRYGPVPGAQEMLLL
jgi:DNA (cytosine-5)-methyltransferase 1